jgi:hypothetical protein
MNVFRFSFANSLLRARPFGRIDHDLVRRKTKCLSFFRQLQVHCIPSSHHIMSHHNRSTTLPVHCISTAHHIDITPHIKSDHTTLHHIDITPHIKSDRTTLHHVTSIALSTFMLTDLSSLHLKSHHITATTWYSTWHRITSQPSSYNDQLLLSELRDPWSLTQCGFITILVRVEQLHRLKNNLWVRPWGERRELSGVGREASFFLFF